MDDVLTTEDSDFREKLDCALRNAVPAGWRFTVKVWALPGDPIDWHMESGLKDPDSEVLVFNKSRNNMPKQDFYLVDFDLQDHSGLALRFEPNPMNAFWVALGDQNSEPSCPVTPSYCDGIYAICADTSGVRLTVRNDDMNVERFSFSLGFVSDVDGSHYRYDPGGNNQNGGSSA